MHAVPTRNASRQHAQHAAGVRPYAVQLRLAAARAGVAQDVPHQAAPYAGHPAVLLPAVRGARD